MNMGSRDANSKSVNWRLLVYLLHPNPPFSCLTITQNNDNDNDNDNDNNDDHHDDHDHDNDDHYNDDHNHIIIIIIIIIMKMIIIKITIMMIMTMTITTAIIKMRIYNARTYPAWDCSRRRVSQCILRLKSSHISLCKWDTIKMGHYFTLKLSTVLAVFTLWGILFHAIGAAQQNARSPYDFKRQGGCERSCLSAERSFHGGS